MDIVKEPDKLVERLTEHPEIKGAHVVVLDGERPVVLVEQQGFVFGAQLRDLLLDELDEGDHAAVSLVMVPDLPRSGDGSVDEGRAGQLAADALSTGQWVLSYVAPVTGTERRVCASIRQVLDVPRVSMTDSLPLLGADSIAMVELSVALQEEFGVALDPAQAFSAPSVQALADLVQPVGSA